MILAHDLGTTGDKASLYSGTGELVASATVPYATDFGPRGKAEQNADDWWQAVAEATRALLAKPTSYPLTSPASSSRGR